MSTDTWVEAYTRDDCLRVEPLDLSIGIELIEIADTKGEIGVGEELDGLGFLQAHEECGNVFGFLVLLHYGIVG